MRAKLARASFEYSVITFATLLLVVGVYFFKFPNNFSFGGVTGIAVVLSAMSKASASSYTFIINMALLVFGFLKTGIWLFILRKKFWCQDSLCQCINISRIVST